MKHRSYKNTNLIGWIVIILGFSFLYFSYFFIYIPKQEAQLKQRAFRILKEYGNNIQDKHDYYKQHFNNYALYYGIRHSGFQPDLKNINPNIGEIQKVVEGLFNVITECRNYRNSKWIDPFQIEGNHMYLQFHNKINNEDLYRITNLVNADSLRLLGEHGLLTSVPVKEFMSGLKFDRLFENFIIFNDTLVYYNSNDDVLVDINNPVALYDSIKAFQGGTYLKLDIRGVDKHVMVLPVHFIGRQFYLAGFITDTTFRDMTRTINNQLLIFLAGLLLLIFIGMPILRVMFLSPHERLSSIDASSSIFSFILGTGILLLLAVSFIKQQFSDNLYYKNRIQLVSDSLYANVLSDIDYLKDLYRSINTLALNRQMKADTTTLSFSVEDTTLLGYIDCHFLGTPKKKPADNLKNHFDRYTGIINSDSKFLLDPFLKGPFPLNEIILINHSGKISKAITHTPFSNLVDIDLSNRKYFTHVKDTNQAWRTKENLKFYIESIQSYNTGQGETAVSFYTTAFDSTITALAITSVIPSLYYQVLHSDVEFMIIEESGKVLYHSIKSKNLHENFLEECDSEPRLTRAVELRVEDKFMINYNGKNWYARIIPIENTPLYHITLIDQVPANNKNARIFLFSFYFFVVSVLLLLLGIVINKWVFNTKKEVQFSWFLKWLDFNTEYHHLYLRLILLLILAISLQAVGVFFIAEPVNILFYQFFFMVYGIYISMVVLKQNELSKKNYIYGLLFILFILSIQTFLSWKPEFMQTLVYTGTVSLVVVVLTALILNKADLFKESGGTAFKAKQKIYLLFLFLLLINLSGIPVTQFFFSVKKMENGLWLQEQMFKVANDNLQLKSVYNEPDAPWFRKVQGNNIDNLEVSYNVSDSLLTDTNLLTNADKIYLGLLDPVTKNYYPRELIKGNNYVREWKLDNRLLYSQAGRDGLVSVTSGGRAGVDYLQLGFIILITFIIVMGFIWLILKYLATVIFNLYPEEQPEMADDWFKHLSNSGSKRILLKSFNGKCYYRHSANFLSDKQLRTESGLETDGLIPIHAHQIFDESLKLQKVLKSNSVVWITGLDDFVYQIDKHDKLLSVMMQINQSPLKKVIVDLPFDIEVITGYYDEYTAENNLNQEDIARLHVLRRRWGNMFKNYHKYNGYSSFKSNYRNTKEENHSSLYNELIKDCIQEFKEDPKTWYEVIWENLSSVEKIVLYDLADDGLLNRKNKPVISRLINKKLIVIKDNLELFDSEFGSFVLKKLTPTSIKAIETELGLKGQWRNIKYLILLILIPLAAFVFMSQGISVEKIFGIIGGALAAITGLLRLFDSSTFKQVSS